MYAATHRLSAFPLGMCGAAQHDGLCCNNGDRDTNANCGRIRVRHRNCVRYRYYALRNGILWNGK